MDDTRIEALRAEIDEINHRLLRIIAERQAISLEIGSLKAGMGLPLYSHEREAQLLAKFRADALEFDLDPDYVEELMNVVLRHSRAAQRDRVEGQGASDPLGSPG
jgi:chorismate mutase-like protein